jgi:hypothetical protein
MNQKDFTLIPNRLIRDATIPDCAFRTYAVLKSFKFGSGKVFPSQETLADIRGKTTRIIIEHLKVLRSKKLISYQKRGFSASNQYHFIDEENFTNETYKGENNFTPIVKKLSPLSLQNLHPNNTKINNTKTKNLPRDIPYKEKISPKESDLIERIVEWNCRPIFNTINPEGEVRRQAYNTVNKYGVEVIWQIFNKIANKAYKPHPKDFWNAIRELKESKNKV